ncbi:MAG: metal-dependent transcriptional regulator [Anaerolineales bacterium]
MQSENAEMYLVSMAVLKESGTPSPIPIPRLAETLEVQTVSANQMVRKLEEEGLVTYLPYKGVSFTKAGSQMVQTILRNRRLWEVFFVEKLGFSPTHADALACRMEHITEPEVAARLDEYLDHPTTSPSGKHIPDINEPLTKKSSLRLSALHPGAQAEIYALNVDAATTAFLLAEQLSPGTIITLQAVSSSGTVLVSIGSRKLSISAEIAGQVLVTSAEGTIADAQ